MSTQAYIDLMFAWGHARLGEAEASRRFVAEAEQRLRPTGNPVHKWLLDAFTYRIEQAIANRPHDGALLPRLIESLESIDDDRHEASRRYVVDQMRRLSRILEPEEQIDPYLPWKKHGSALQRRVFMLLRDVVIRADVGTERGLEQFSPLLHELESSADILDRCWCYRAVGEGPREVARRFGPDLVPLGRQLAVRVLQQRWIDHPDVAALFAMHRPPPGSGAKAGEWRIFQEDCANQGVWVERAAHLAAVELLRSIIQLATRISRPDLLADCFQDVLGLGLEAPAPIPPWAVVLPLSKGLVQLGMKNEAAELADRLLDHQSAEFQRTNDPDRLKVCLGLAALDLWLGRAARAEPVLALARSKLAEIRTPVPATGVRCEYLGAIANAPWPDAHGHVRQLLAGLPRLRSTFTTASFFSRLHLDISERVVFVVAKPNVYPAEDLLRSMSASEIAPRREALVEVRGKLVEWGQKDWGPAKSK